MNKKIILSLFSLMSINVGMSQFNTILNESKAEYIILGESRYKPEILEIDTINIFFHETDSLIVPDKDKFRIARNKPERRKKSTTIPVYSIMKSNRLKGFSITALYQEILKNEIRHPKIVLAQAILETGWFKSSVCRNKGNLFGLTNPRTGQYYEFDDWRESVKAYKTKVQYKYSEGNYLMWLKEIGYAEDPRYVSSLIKILEQYLL